MATLNEKIQSGFERVVALLKTVRDDVNGKIGTLSTLNTTQKASLVQALNELKSNLDSFSQIDDTKTAADTIWSSQKTSDAITAAITAILDGADGANDTLKELADRISAEIQARASTDAQLVGVGAAQTFTDTEKAQGRANIGAQSAAEIGDVSAADFVAAVNSAFNAS